MQIAETLHDQAIRCILFDLGETLWTRADAETWNPLLWTANRRARALLDGYVVSPLCAAAVLDDASLYDYVIAHDPYDVAKHRLHRLLVRPDLTIEHVGDLLTFLPKVGTL